MKHDQQHHEPISDAHLRYPIDQPVEALPGFPIQNPELAALMAHSMYGHIELKRRATELGMLPEAAAQNKKAEAAARTTEATYYKDRGFTKGNLKTLLQRADQANPESQPDPEILYDELEELKLARDLAFEFGLKTDTLRLQFDVRIRPKPNVLPNQAFKRKMIDDYVRTSLRDVSPLIDPSDLPFPTYTTYDYASKDMRYEDAGYDMQFRTDNQAFTMEYYRAKIHSTLLTFLEAFKLDTTTAAPQRTRAIFEHLLSDAADLGTFIASEKTKGLAPSHALAIFAFSDLARFNTSQIAEVISQLFAELKNQGMDPYDPAESTENETVITDAIKSALAGLTREKTARIQDIRDNYEQKQAELKRDGEQRRSARVAEREQRAREKQQELAKQRLIGQEAVYAKIDQIAQLHPELATFADNFELGANVNVGSVDNIGSLMSLLSRTLISRSDSEPGKPATPLFDVDGAELWASTFKKPKKHYGGSFGSITATAIPMNESHQQKLKLHETDAAIAVKISVEVMKSLGTKHDFTSSIDAVAYIRTSVSGVRSTRVEFGVGALELNDDQKTREVEQRNSARMAHAVIATGLANPLQGGGIETSRSGH